MDLASMARAALRAKPRAEEEQSLERQKAVPVSGAKAIAPNTDVLGSLANVGLSGLAMAGNLLDVPGSMVRDVATWVPGGIAAQNPFDQLLSPVSSKNRVTGSEIADSVTGGAIDKDSWLGLGTGIALEIGMDPLTYLSLGGSAVGKGGAALRKAGLDKNLVRTANKIAGKELGDQAGRRLGRTSARQTLTPRQAIDDIVSEESLSVARMNAVNEAKRPLEKSVLKRAGKDGWSQDAVDSAMKRVDSNPDVLRAGERAQRETYEAGVQEGYDKFFRAGGTEAMLDEKIGGVAKFSIPFISKKFGDKYPMLRERLLGATSLGPKELASTPWFARPVGDVADATKVAPGGSRGDDLPPGGSAGPGGSPADPSGSPGPTVTPTVSPQDVRPAVSAKDFESISPQHKLFSDELAKLEGSGILDRSSSGLMREIFADSTLDNFQRTYFRPVKEIVASPEALPGASTVKGIPGRFVPGSINKIELSQDALIGSDGGQVYAVDTLLHELGHSMLSRSADKQAAAGVDILGEFKKFVDDGTLEQYFKESQPENAAYYLGNPEEAFAQIFSDSILNRKPTPQGMQAFIESVKKIAQDILAKILQRPGLDSDVSKKANAMVDLVGGFMDADTYKAMFSGDADVAEAASAVVKGTKGGVEDVVKARRAAKKVASKSKPPATPMDIEKLQLGETTDAILKRTELVPAKYAGIRSTQEILERVQDADGILDEVSGITFANAAEADAASDLATARIKQLQIESGDRSGMIFADYDGNQKTGYRLMFVDGRAVVSGAASEAAKPTRRVQAREAAASEDLSSLDEMADGQVFDSERQAFEAADALNQMVPENIRSTGVGYAARELDDGSFVIQKTDAPDDGIEFFARDEPNLEEDVASLLEQRRSGFTDTEMDRLDSLEPAIAREADRLSPLPEVADVGPRTLSQAIEDTARRSGTAEALEDDNWLARMAGVTKPRTARDAGGASPSSLRADDASNIGKEVGDEGEKFQAPMTAEAAGAAVDELEDAAVQWREKGVESPYFKRWFGGSKIRDDSGNPRELYHGSLTAFNQFSPQTNKSIYGRGVYLTSQAEDAWQYGTSNTSDFNQVMNMDLGPKAESLSKELGIPYREAKEALSPTGGMIYKVYAKIENPLHLSDAPLEFDERKLRLAIAESDSPVESFDRLVRRLRKAPTAKDQHDILLQEKASGALSSYASLSGHDGIVVSGKFAPRSGGANHVIALRPTQVKSATGNRGTFDAASADIRYQAPRSAGGMFQEEAINRIESNSYKSRSKVIAMPIDDFLDLAESGRSALKASTVDGVVDSGEKFSSIPSLTIKKADGNAVKVVGHEGRHRARKLKSMGYSHIPVEVTHATLRWTEQSRPGSFDYEKSFPEEIIGEEGSLASEANRRIPVPIRREDVGLSFRDQVTRLAGDEGEKFQAPRTPVETKQVSHRDVTKRIPELTEAAKGVADGRVTREEYAELVDKLKPVRPYSFVPRPATREEAVNALTANKRGSYGNANEIIEEGESVGLRLDIPAYRDHSVWVNSIHRAGKKDTIYDSVSAVTDANLLLTDSAQKQSLKVATGTAKSPFAVIKGQWKKISQEDAVAKVDEALRSDEWVQVGFDPERHSYFYDRETGQPIGSAAEVIQIGPLLVARGAMPPSAEASAKLLYQAPKKSYGDFAFDAAKGAASGTREAFADAKGFAKDSGKKMLDTGTDLYRQAMGVVGNDKAAAVGVAMDTLGGFVKNSAPVRVLTGMFDPSVMGGTTELSQEVGREHSKALEEATYGIRKRIFPMRDALNQSEPLDPNKLLAKYGDEAKSRSAFTENYNAIRRYLEDASPLLNEGKAYQLPSELASLKPALDDMRSALNEIRTIELDSGLKSPELDDMFIRYFTRQLEKFPGDKGSQGNLGKVLDPGTPYQNQRQDFLTNIPGGTATINEISIDPEISGIAHSFPNKQVPADVMEDIKRKISEQYGGGQVGSKQRDNIFMLEEGRRTEQLDRFAKWVTGLDPRYAENGIPVFKLDPVQDMMVRMEAGLRASAAANFSTSLLARGANPAEAGGMSMAEVADRLAREGMDGNAAVRNIANKMGDKYKSKYQQMQEQAGKDIVRDVLEYSDGAGDEGVLFNSGDSIRARIKSTGESGRIIGVNKDGSYNFEMEARGKVEVPTGKDIELPFGSPVPQTVKKNAPKSYANVDPSDIEGDISPRDVLKQFSVDGNVADSTFAYMRGFTQPESVNVFTDAIRQMTNLTKSSLTVGFPAFHVRNFVSGQYNNYLGKAADPRFKGPKAYWQPVRDADAILRGSDIDGILDIPIIKEKGISNTKDAMQFLREEIFANKLIGSTQGSAGDIIGREVGSFGSQAPQSGKRSMRDILLKPPPAPAGSRKYDWMNPLGAAGVLGNESDTFLPLRWGRQVGEYVEGLNRIAPYLSYLRQGMDSQTAAKKVMELQFDYSKLTPTDRKLRLWFPFYTYTKNIVPLTVKQLIERPGGRLAQTIRAGTASSSSEPMPDHIARTTAIPFGARKIPGQGDRSFVTGLGFGFEDALSFGSILGGDLQGFTREVASRSNPLLKFGLEQMAGESMYFDGPGGGRDLSDLDPTYGRIRSNIADLVTGNKTVGRAEPIFGSELAENILGNMPTSRLGTTLRTLTDSRKLANPIKMGLNLGTGVKVTDVSEASWDAAMQNKAIERMKELGAREFSRRYFPEYLKERMSDGELTEAEALNEFVGWLGERAKDRKAERDASDSGGK
jgi:hypothetical protein